MLDICVTSPLFPNPAVTVAVDDSGIMLRIVGEPKHRQWCGVHITNVYLAELLGSVLVHSHQVDAELLAALTNYIKAESH